MNIPESVTNGELPGLTLIGDLDGSYIHFASFAQQSGCMDIDGRWIGGGQIVIFSGDILADRRPDGFRILEAIRHLRRDAQKAGGDIVVLAGNHEEVMIGFLIGDNLNAGPDASPHSVKKGSQFYGLSELKRYGETREQIITNMREDIYGKRCLENICELKLMYRVGASIHFHTPPSRNILDLILAFYNKIGNLDVTIDYINKQWGMALRTKLLGEEFSPTENKNTKNPPNADTVYTLFRDSFLLTANGSLESFKKRIQGSIVQGILTEDVASKILQDIEKNRVITPSTHSIYDILKKMASIQYVTDMTHQWER